MFRSFGEWEFHACSHAEVRSPGGVKRSPGTGSDVEPLSDDELRTLRLRMQGLVDQMAAGVARIDQLGLSLRDIESGLVDFPALVAGRQVWLCWRRGEPQIGWWHDLDTGFSGRRPLSELA